MKKGIYENDKEIRTKIKLFFFFFDTNRISDVIVQRDGAAATGYL